MYQGIMQSKLAQVFKSKPFMAVIAFLLIFSILGAVVAMNNNATEAALVALLIAIPSLLVLIYSSSKLQQDFLRKQIEDAARRKNEEKLKPKDFWSLAQIRLDAYIERNLSQVSWIFWLSVVVMFSGLGVVIWGIGEGIKTASTEATITSSKNLPAIFLA